MPRSKRSSRSAARWLVMTASAACLAITTTILGAAPSLAAGTYSTTGSVNVRSGPGTGYQLIGTEPSGAQFSLLCQWQGGTNINGNATWDKVTFANGATYKAAVVGTDPSTDLAVIKVDAPSSLLHPLGLANSDDVAVGDGVVAIGSPFGLENTLTTGVVSAINRTIDGTNGYSIPGAIQTDAAINHGNSGGVLLNMQGDVIGVTSQIESESGGNVGIGFAIPSNTVRSVAGQLVSGQKVEHAYLGVSLADAASGGARIATVTSGSPAADAGLKTGDVVTALDGTSISDAEELTVAVVAKQPGDTVKITVTRDGSTKTLTATLGTRPSS